MRDLRPRCKAYLAGAWLVLREPGEHRPGTHDMLFFHEAEGATADDLSDRLERGFHTNPSFSTL